MASTLCAHSSVSKLPSFRDFCEGLSSSQESASLTSRTEEDPCITKCDDVTPVPAPPRLSGEDSKYHDDVLSPPQQMGWFDPNTEHAKATYESVKMLNADQLFQKMFTIDSSRPIYGNKTILKKMTLTKPSVLNKGKVLFHNLHRHDSSHTRNEKDRRNNHGMLMTELHRSTPELAHQLAERDQQMLQWKKSGSSKGPGKYDQLISDLYMHDLSAIIVQSQYEARKAAERREKELERTLTHLRSAIEVYEHRIADYDLHDCHRPAIRLKKRRIADYNEQSDAAWEGRCHRLSRSPSATSSVSSFIHCS